MFRLRWLAAITSFVLLSAVPLLATLTFAPSQPLAGQIVTFTLSGTQLPNDPTRLNTWDFGDGTTQQTSYAVLNASHIYLTPGTYRATASYFYATPRGVVPMTDEAMITVAAPNRSVTFSPSQPMTGETITFQAQNFLTPFSSAWDFGDGATIPSGGSTQTHAYNNPGAYLVQARDQGGSAPPVTVSVAVLNNRQVVFSPSQPNVGETVTFQAQNFLTPDQIAWDFGDGATVLSGGAVQIHAYNAPGAFTVQARDNRGSAPPVAVFVTVLNKRSLVFGPPQPNVGETVAFQAQNFIAPNAIAWNFGDGATVASGGANQSHVYNAVGTFLVQARDQGGAGASATVSVPVVNRRQIQISPAAVQTGKAVQFQALNFTTTCIRWNFGDGTILDQGTPVQSHTYAKPGAFQVQATDNCGNSTWSASTNVLVAPSEGPLAAFSVSYGILRFEDGKTNIIVPKSAMGLAAFADLKYEGTGTLLVEWRVDGQPFKSDSAVLTFGQQTTLSSGKLPGLPTLVPGTHTVELILRRPGGAFTLPPIVYTVSSAVQDKSTAGGVYGPPSPSAVIQK